MILTCSDLHRDHFCPGTFSDIDRFCPICGSRNVSLRLNANSPIIVEPGKQNNLNISATPRLPLSEKLTVHLELVPNISGDARLKIESSTATFTQSREIILDTIPLKEGDEYRGRLRVSIEDSIRGPESGSWTTRSPEVFSIEIYVRCQSQFASIYPEIVLLTGHTNSSLLSIESKRGFRDLDIAVEGDFVLREIDESARDFQRRSYQLAAGEGVFGLLGTLTISSPYVPDGVKKVPVVRLSTSSESDSIEWVVAIDFGTSGTSIYLRNRFAGTAGRKIGNFDRATSDLYIPGPNNAYWEFSNAVDQIDESDQRRRHVWSGLKTRLRAAEIDIIHGHTIVEVLTWYFTELRKIIVKELGKNDILESDKDRVAFVFTVPALDQGQEYHLYMDRFNEILKESGFEQFGIVTTMLEPEAALIWCVTDQNASARSGLTSAGVGQAANVMLVDSGAGTTDVTVTRLDRAGGEINFSETRTFGVYFNELFHKGEVANSSFGGDVSTAALATRFIDQGISSRFADSFLEEYGGARIEDESTAENGLLPTYRRENWLTRFPVLRHRMERIKFDFLQYRRGYTFFFSGKNFNLDAQLADSVFSDLAETLKIELRTSLSQLDLDPDHVVCIGGNSLIGPYRNAAELAVDRNAEISTEKSVFTADEIRLAVVKGALRRFDRHFDASLYDLECRIGNQRRPLLQKGRLGRTANFIVPPGSATLEFFVLTEFGSGVLESLEIDCSFPTRVEIKCSGQSVKVLQMNGDELYKEYLVNLP